MVRRCGDLVKCSKGSTTRGAAPLAAAEGGALQCSDRLPAEEGLTYDPPGPTRNQKSAALTRVRNAPDCIFAAAALNRAKAALRAAHREHQEAKYSNILAAVAERPPQSRYSVLYGYIRRARRAMTQARQGPT